MYQRNLEIIDKPGDARMKEFLLLKNKIRFAQSRLKSWSRSSPNREILHSAKYIALYTWPVIRIYSINSIRITIPPGKFPMIGLPDRNNIFDDVFLEYRASFPIEHHRHTIPNSKLLRPCSHKALWIYWRYLGFESFWCLDAVKLHHKTIVILEFVSSTLITGKSSLPFG